MTSAPRWIGPFLTLFSSLPLSSSSTGNSISFAPGDFNFFLTVLAFGYFVGKITIFFSSHLLILCVPFLLLVINQKHSENWREFRARTFHSQFAYWKFTLASRTLLIILPSMFFVKNGVTILGTNWICYKNHWESFIYSFEYKNKQVIIVKPRYTNVDTLPNLESSNHRQWIVSRVSYTLVTPIACSSASSDQGYERQQEFFLRQYVWAIYKYILPVNYSH